jgi:membrane protein implicated in regulation of membrane protease activity
VTFVVLFILAVVWAVYLASWFRSRSETRSVNSISSFSRHLSVLERTAPGAGTSPARAADFGPARAAAGLGPLGSPVGSRSPQSVARKRRKDILMGLLTATAMTALAGFFVGGVFVLLFGLSFVLTVAYVVLLAQARKRLVEKRAKVRYLAPQHTARSAEPGWEDEYWSERVHEGRTADGTYLAVDRSYPQGQAAYVAAQH